MLGDQILSPRRVLNNTEGFRGSLCSKILKVLVMLNVFSAIINGEGFFAFCFLMFVSYKEIYVFPYIIYKSRCMLYPNN